jgi:hypothetical protein
MLASFPASMVNQKPADLGIPNRFNLTTSRFNRAGRRLKLEPTNDLLIYAILPEISNAP